MSETTSTQHQQDDAPKPATMLIVLAAIVAYAFWKPDNARTIGIFLLTLGILVFVHEWGHYQFARWGGMKVNRFGIGFPPWIFTKRYKGIDYSIGALPIGGMVDIAGLGSEEEMVATAKDGTLSGVQEMTEGQSAIDENTRQSTHAPSAPLASNFDRYNNRKPDAPHGEKEFQDAKLGWRFWTLFAGPLMNFLFALVVFVGVYSVIGVAKVDQSVITIVDVVSGFPAAKADLRVDDVITAIDGVPAKDPLQVTKTIRNSGGAALNLTIDRAGTTLQKTLQPQMDEATKLDGSGVEKAPLIGVQFGPKVIGYQRVSVSDAALLGWSQAKFITTQIFGLLGRAATFNLSKEDKRGVGGPVKIAQAVGQSAKRGWQETALLAAALSVNLGLLNLLPFPALDGGRILFLGYELVMRRPVNARTEGFVHMVGMVMLLAFMLFITLRDVVPFFQGLR